MEVDITVNGIKEKDGTDAPPIKHRMTLVEVKKNGKWLIYAAR